MTSNYSRIELESEETEYKDVNVTFYILRIYTTLYHTYQLLYCKGQVQMASTYSTIEEEARKIEYKNETSHSI